MILNISFFVSHQSSSPPCITWPDVCCQGPPPCERYSLWAPCRRPGTCKVTLTVLSTWEGEKYLLDKNLKPVNIYISCMAPYSLKLTLPSLSGLVHRSSDGICHRPVLGVDWGHVSPLRCHGDVSPSEHHTGPGGSKQHSPRTRLDILPLEVLPVNVGGRDVFPSRHL